MSHDQDQSEPVDHTLKVDDDDLFASAVQVGAHRSGSGAGCIVLFLFNGKNRLLSWPFDLQCLCSSLCKFWSLVAIELLDAVDSLFHCYTALHCLL